MKENKFIFYFLLVKQHQYTKLDVINLHNFVFKTSSLYYRNPLYWDPCIKNTSYFLTIYLFGFKYINILKSREC